MPSNIHEVKNKHSKAQQFFYVLSVQATFMLEDKRIILNSNEGLHVAAEVGHCIMNKQEEALSFLVISQPHAHGDRILL